MTHPTDFGSLEAARYGFTRSHAWPATRNRHLKIEPYCIACSQAIKSSAPRQVHHIFPFHYCLALGRPDLELDHRNLVTLCEREPGHPAENHHLLIGHLNDFQSSNLDVITDATTTFFGMSAAQIKQAKNWLLKEAVRLKPLDQMTENDKANFKARMDAHFPLA